MLRRSWWKRVILTLKLSDILGLIGAATTLSIEISGDFNKGVSIPETEALSLSLSLNSEIS